MIVSRFSSLEFKHIIYMHSNSHAACCRLDLELVDLLDLVSARHSSCGYFFWSGSSFEISESELIEPSSSWNMALNGNMRKGKMLRETKQSAEHGAVRTSRLISRLSMPGSESSNSSRKNGSRSAAESAAGESDGAAGAGQLAGSET